MSKSVTCDNCGDSAPDTPDDTLHWVKLGWFLGGEDDACSVDCARALLEAMELQRWEIEQQVEAEEASGRLV